MDETHFIGATVEVEMAGEGVLLPTLIHWEGREYRVAEVLTRWFDFGFGPEARPNPRWWQRRHRNYYRVRTEDDHVFELYFDRGVNRKHPERRKWVLFKSIGPKPGQGDRLGC